MEESKAADRKCRRRAHTTMAASTYDGEVLVGEPAKRQSITNSDNADAMEVSRQPVAAPDDG